MTDKSMFLACVAADHSVTRGKQTWPREKIVTRRKVEPGQLWIFLSTPEGLHAMEKVDDTEIAAAELMKRLRAQLLSQPKSAKADLETWSRGDPETAAILVGSLLAACETPTEVLLNQLSRQLQRDRAPAAQAFVKWCTRDPEAAAVIRSTLEEAAIPNPDAPVILVRRIDAEIIEVPPVFGSGILVRVSPNGRRLSLSHVKTESAPPDRHVRVYGLAFFSPWQGTPYDMLLRHDDATNSFVGILSAQPRESSQRTALQIPLQAPPQVGMAAEHGAESESETGATVTSGVEEAEGNASGGFG